MSSQARGTEEARKAAMAVGISTKSSSRREAEEALLPGLPDDIALDLVVPKLPWTAFRVLVSVSRVWRSAIRSHRVHEARVRANSTEKLFVLNHIGGKCHAISLFSVRDRACFHLPPYPNTRKSQRGMPFHCRFASVDGKIYILGGLKDYGGNFDYCSGEDSDDDEEESNEVYVLDVAGNRGWEKCASMPEPTGRHDFGCGVFDGKIYVFGGLTASYTATRSCLVYDPQANAWSSLRPMEHLGVGHHVVTVGEELIVLSEHLLNMHQELFIEVYHPGRDEWRWRSVEPFGVHDSEHLFIAKGKLHMITPQGVYGHAIDSDGKYSWMLQHSFTSEDKSITDEGVVVLAIDTVNDELLGLIDFDGTRGYRTGICQSKGFGGEKEEILWDLVSGEILRDAYFPRLMCPIQL